MQLVMSQRLVIPMYLVLTISSQVVHALSSAPTANTTSNAGGQSAGPDGWPPAFDVVLAVGAELCACTT